MNRNLRKSDFSGGQDLEWTAFCYLADEMSESEKSEFEIRLQHDFEAQQAVVAAMEQSQAIYQALSQSEKTHEPVAVASTMAVSAYSARRIPGYLFAAAASLLVIVVGWGWYANQDSTETVANNTGTIITLSESDPFNSERSESERLAEAWIDTFVTMNDNDWTEVLDDEPVDIESGEEASEDWMFVALTDMEASMEGAE